jgi:hypothetical protein
VIVLFTVSFCLSLFIFVLLFPSIFPLLPSRFCISLTACFYGLQTGLYEVLQEPDKIGYVRITEYWGAFPWPLLPWKNNTYYELRVCVCNLSYRAFNAHAPYCHLWSVRLYRIFSHYFINGTILKKEGIEHKMCVLIFCTTFVWDISHIIEFFPLPGIFIRPPPPPPPILSQVFLFFIMAIRVVLCNCIFLHLADNTALNVRSDFNIAKQVDYS